MRPGGESDKWSNRYEGCWTIYNVLDLLRSSCTEMQIEPLCDGLGVEFIKVMADGTREYHSVKVQTTTDTWTVSMLAAAKTNGRSILGDLFGKLSDPKAQARFISEVGANSLRLLCEDAKASPDSLSFQQRLSNARQTDFDKFILPMCGRDGAKALDYLTRTHVVSFTLRELTDAVEREISRCLYRPDAQPLDSGAVRCVLGDFILNSLGKRLDRAMLLMELQRIGLSEANWARDRSIRDRVEARNESYRRSVRGQLINGATISRQEARDAFNVIVAEPDRFGAFVGIAGLGKSCTVAELLDILRNFEVPHIALRLDHPFEALTPRQLGLALDLPTSPVDVLAGIAEGRLCALVLDQLDALSIVSGRNPKLWPLVDDLLAEAKEYPRMKVWLACRAFDLDHDPRLRALFTKEKARRIDLRLLTSEEVTCEVQKARVRPERLSPQQIDLLRTPMHLSLYLEGDPANRPPFKTVQDLYDRYWERKQDLVRARLGRDPEWTAVVDLLCDWLSAHQVLSSPADFLDESYRTDARAMASENVLAYENGHYRFFHEGFFDYAFARRFVRRGKRLTDLLLDHEQHIFRRAQVRQVLTYLRGQDHERYLRELQALLNTPRVRNHIVKLVLDWLKTLTDPTEAELALLRIA